jgi:hypothetical protein
MASFAYLHDREWGLTGLSHRRIFLGTGYRASAATALFSLCVTPDAETKGAANAALFYSYNWLIAASSQRFQLRTALSRPSALCGYRL